MDRNDVARHSDALTGKLPRIPPSQDPPTVTSTSLLLYASERASPSSAAAHASASPTLRSTELTRRLSYPPEPFILMSNQHHAGPTPPGLPGTYPPAPSSYSTQNLSGLQANQYSTYANSTHQAGDVYRGTASMSNSPQPLPSMRTFDPMSQQRPLPHNPTHGMPLPPQEHTGLPYYSAPLMGLNQAYGMPPDAGGNRYTLPPDPRFMGHRPGQKKVRALHPDSRSIARMVCQRDQSKADRETVRPQEIKRRTKTGCLTCRRRRIKCDESQPTCNNCKKSKRECAGYDPMFRQATSPSQGSPKSQTSQAGISSTTSQQSGQQTGLSPSPSSSNVPTGSGILGNQYPGQTNLLGSFSPSPRQTPPLPGSNISQDSQLPNLSSNTLKGQPTFDYSQPAADHYRPNLTPDLTYSTGYRQTPDDYYGYRGGPPPS